MPESPCPGGPASSRNELTGLGAVGLEALLPQPKHLLQACIVFPNGGGGCCGCELRLEQGPEGSERTILGGTGQPVVAEAGFPLLGDQAGFFQEAEMTRDARLREAENRGELGDVEAMKGEDAEQPKPRLLAEQPVQRGGQHIINL